MKESCAEQNKEELRSAGGNIHVHKKLLKTAHCSSWLWRTGEELL